MSLIIGLILIGIALKVNNEMLSIYLMLIFLGLVIVEFIYNLKLYMEVRKNDRKIPRIAKKLHRNSKTQRICKRSDRNTKQIKKFIKRLKKKGECNMKEFLIDLIEGIKKIIVFIPNKVINHFDNYKYLEDKLKEYNSYKEATEKRLEQIRVAAEGNHYNADPDIFKRKIAELAKTPIDYQT